MMIFAVVTPCGEHSDMKMKLAKLTSHQFLMAGDLVVCQALNGRENFAKVVVPTFSADEKTMLEMWRVGADDVRTITARLTRYDFEDKDVVEGLPEVE